MSPDIEGADPVRTDDPSPPPKDWPADLAAAVWLGHVCAGSSTARPPGCGRSRLWGTGWRVEPVEGL